MKKKISTAILAAAICLCGCYIGGNNEVAKTYAIEEPVPTEITMPTEQIAYAEPGCYIKIASEPDKVIYHIGDELDLTGLKLEVMFAYGGEMPISQVNNNWRTVNYSENPLEDNSFIIDTSDFDSSKSGKYNIKISLTQEAQLKWWYCSPKNIPVTVIDDESFIKGDVNADGSFTVADIVLFQKWLMKTPDTKLINWKAADLCEDGKLDVFDLCAMKRKLIELTQPEPEPDKSVEAFIPVAEFLFSELDNGTIKVGDVIYEDDFKALAGEDSELYKNLHSSYNYTGNLKPSEEINIEYLLEIVSEDDPFYEYLKDTEKLDLLCLENRDEFRNLYEHAIPDHDKLKPEDLFSPAGLENYKALFESYDFIYAYIHDNDTIVINNGTGWLFRVDGIIITRNGKNLENNYISVPEKFGYDDNDIYVNEKINGYDNVYGWSTTTFGDF